MKRKEIWEKVIDEQIAELNCWSCAVLEPAQHEIALLYRLKRLIKEGYAKEKNKKS